MAEKKPLYQRTWFIVVMAILLLGVVGNALNGGSDAGSGETSSQEPVAEETASTTPTETPSPEQTPSPEASESVAAETSAPVDPDSADNVAYFVLSSIGNLKDLNKDVNDAVKRAEADESFRLLGNILEFSFNFGQLQSLTAPTQVSEKWLSGMAKLEKKIDASSDAAAEFLSGTVSTSQMVSALEKVRTQLNTLADLVGTVEVGK